MIFRQMIRFQGHDRWQRVFDRVLAKSRFDLPNPVVDDYFARSFEHVVGYLRDRGGSPAAALDPVGEINLRLAKKARRLALSDHAADRPEVLAEMADDFFPFSTQPLRYWAAVTDSDFAPAITSRNAGRERVAHKGRRTRKGRKSRKRKADGAPPGDS
jgi:hypothetical protein